MGGGYRAVASLSFLLLESFVLEKGSAEIESVDDEMGKDDEGYKAVGCFGVDGSG